jgi:hypothetical protein
MCLFDALFPRLRFIDVYVEYDVGRRQKRWYGCAIWWWSEGMPDFWGQTDGVGSAALLYTSNRSLEDGVNNASRWGVWTDDWKLIWPIFTPANETLRWIPHRHFLAVTCWPSRFYAPCDAPPSALSSIDKPNYPITSLTHHNIIFFPSTRSPRTLFPRELHYLLESHLLCNKTVAERYTLFIQSFSVDRVLSR